MKNSVNYPFSFIKSLNYQLCLGDNKERKKTLYFINVTCKSGECFSEQEDCFCAGKEKHELKNLKTERRDKRSVCGECVNGRGRRRERGRLDKGAK